MSVARTAALLVVAFGVGYARGFHKGVHTHRVRAVVEGQPTGGHDQRRWFR